MSATLKTPFLRGWLSFVFLAVLTLQAAHVASQTTEARQAQPLQLTSEQDHQRMMDLLHITSLRRGADGDPKSPNAAHYEESKAGTPKLPDPLLLRNGKRAGSARTSSIGSR